MDFLNKEGLCLKCEVVTHEDEERKMNRDTAMGEFEFSYEELRRLEAHYKNMQKKTVIYKLKKTPAKAINLLQRLTSESKPAENDKVTSVELEYFESEVNWPLGSP